MLTGKESVKEQSSTDIPITERLVFLFSKVSSLELLQERQAFFLLVIMMIKIDPIFSVPHKKL